jgi:hypothetical protein
MKDVGVFSKIFIARDSVDFRKQARGLASIAKEVLDANVSCGKTLFVFFNKRKDAVKMLYCRVKGPKAPPHRTPHAVFPHEALQIFACSIDRLRHSVGV